MYRQMIASTAGSSYGLGMGTGSHEGHRVLYHYGGIDGFDAAATHYPDDDLTIAVLANASGDNAGDVEARVAREILGIRSVPSVPLTQPELERFAGTYRADRGFEVHLVARDATLFLQLPGDTQTVKLTYGGNGTFRTDPPPNLVVIDGGRLRMTHYGAVLFEATRVP
jgi:hypothetical protein